MLSAHNEQGQIIIAHHHSRQSLRRLKKQHDYTCPECRERVMLKIGQTKLPHFSHLKHTSCRQQFGESEFHYQGKIQLFKWLKSQFNHVYLEHYLSDLQQIPDIYIETETKRLAIEFQCANIPTEIIQKRTAGYLAHDIRPIWILGANQLKRKGQRKFTIDHFTKHFIHQFPRHKVDFLIYYCSKTSKFMTLSNLIMTSKTQAIAQLTFHHIQSTKFPQLLKTPQVDHQLISHTFYKIKKQFRQKKHAPHWLKQLYHKGMHPSHLPSIIYLPIVYGYLAKLAPWEWQAIFIIEYFMPMSLGHTFEVSQVIEAMAGYFYQASTFLLIEEARHPMAIYLLVLRQLGYIESATKESYQKVKEIPLTQVLANIERGDMMIMKRLSQLNNGIEK